MFCRLTFCLLVTLVTLAIPSQLGESKEVPFQDLPVLEDATLSI